MDWIKAKAVFLGLADFTFKLKISPFETQKKVGLIFLSVHANHKWSAQLKAVLCLSVLSEYWLINCKSLFSSKQLISSEENWLFLQYNAMQG